MKVIVVGGGIGGFATALSLRSFGIDVQVLEQSKALREVGAGIQIAANGALVLRKLGLEEALAAVSVQPLSWEYRDMETGIAQVSWPLGREAATRYGAPLYNVHRADLIQLLVDALPKEAIRFNSKCADIGQDNDTAWIKLESGEVLHADVIIGADGIHSVVREKLFGPAQEIFANFLVWRALIPAEKMPPLNYEERGNYWVGPGRSIVSYWVRPQKLYSFLASVPVTEVHRETWAESGDVEDLLKSFHGSEPRVQKMLEAIDSTFITGMYYRDPLEHWTHGRFSLIGDAAHAMVPYLAQGACQAIEDGWILATTLARHGDASVKNALIEYEQRRLPRATRVQSAARNMVKIVHEFDADRIKARNGRWRGMSRIDPLGETTWNFVWGYDVLKAAEEPVGDVLGHTTTKQGKRLNRPESQRAFDLWKTALSPENIARGHDGMREGYDQFLLTNFPRPSDAIVRDVEFEGVKCLEVHTNERHSDKIILHFHGGAYVIGSAKGSIEYATRLAKSISGRCISVDYRLAPEHPYPAAIDDAINVYRGLLDSGVDSQQIILSGESSGGGLAIALGIAIRNAGFDMPSGILSICPFADLTLKSESLRKFHGDDPAANIDLLAYFAASYFQGHEPTDPMVSPLFDSLKGLPPIFMSAATNEVLFNDATRFADKAKNAGNQITFKKVDDSVHVFTLFSFLPETREVMDDFSNWVKTL